MMDGRPVTPEPLCAKEVLDLLNCVADPQFERDKCLRFFDALRACVIEKKVKKFSLAKQDEAKGSDDAKDKS